jgi:U3 small nucleolar RNA-associated protein 25
MTVDGGTSQTTRLLTLLNVSATKLGKRKFDEFAPSSKLNKRKVSILEQPIEQPIASNTESEVPPGPADSAADEAAEIDVDTAVDIGSQDSQYEKYFGCKPSLLSEITRNATQSRRWRNRRVDTALGSAVESIPEGSDQDRSFTQSPEVRYLFFVLYDANNTLSLLKNL